MSKKKIILYDIDDTVIKTGKYRMFLFKMAILNLQLPLSNIGLDTYNTYQNIELLANKIKGKSLKDYFRNDREEIIQILKENLKDDSVIPTIGGKLLLNNDGTYQCKWIQDIIDEMQRLDNLFMSPLKRNNLAIKTPEIVPGFFNTARKFHDKNFVQAFWSYGETKTQKTILKKLAYQEDGSAYNWNSGFIDTALISGRDDVSQNGAKPNLEHLKYILNRLNLKPTDISHITFIDDSERTIAALNSLKQLNQELDKKDQISGKFILVNNFEIDNFESKRNIIMDKCRQLQIDQSSVILEDIRKNGWNNLIATILENHIYEQKSFVERVLKSKTSIAQTKAI